MTLHVVYRATPVGNKRERPVGFSKWLCLVSFLRAVEAVRDAEVTFLCDGDLPSEVVRLMSERGVVCQLGGVGNSSSYLAGVDVLAEPQGDGVGYLCEDDYLHLPDSLRWLCDATMVLGDGHYLTLYDHPDRYVCSGDLRTPGRQIEVVVGHHLRSVESTAMTFGATLSTFRADRRLLSLAARYTKYPHDRSMWRSIQGLGVRLPLRFMRTPRRRLLGAVPALATHMEAEFMAPVIDWRLALAETEAWALDRRLGVADGW